MFKKRSWTCIACCAIAAVPISGCVSSAGGVYVPAPYPQGGQKSYPGGRIYIPEGHMPPPGECRIWYPDLEPGQQPPPGDCRELERHVPPGAVLVRG